jgi:hypothetical protein
VVNRVYRLRGPLAVDALAEAFTILTARHEALRCSLHEDASELVMQVRSTVPQPLARVDSEGWTEAALSAWLAEETTRPIDRGTAPLLRATLARLGHDDHVLVIVLDHIISDGWSVELLAHELSIAYQVALGLDATLPGEVQQYPAWVAQQRAALTDERLAARAGFWRDRFPGGPEETAVWLSGYRAPSEPAQASVGVVETVLDQDLTDRLRHAARRLRVTLNVMTAVVFVRLLQRDTGQERITLSTSSASRFSPDTATMIGYLATTIWIPTTLAGADELPAAVHAFQRDMLEVMAQSDVPARTVFERLWGPQARELMNAVPQVDFLCTPFWGGSLTFPGICVTASEHDDGSADGALSMYLSDRDSHIEVQVRFVAEAFKEGYARRMLEGYVADLTAVADQFR